MKPLILINFKTYLEATGKKAVLLAQKIAAVQSKKYQLAIAPPTLELEHVCKAVNIKVFAQHLDSDDYGAHTGEITAKDVKKLGATGTLLNHSERKLAFPILQKTVQECQKDKLQVIICASSLQEIKKMVRLKPTYIAYEPAALIGGEKSVTSSKPEIIKQAVQLVSRMSPDTKVLCGAGVHSREDILAAIQLGAAGVLIGHAVPKAKDPKKFLEKMTQ